ncbi:sensor histidine kinase [Magnetospirillum sp. LM-5]|uniref:sensor histidine kinase n=1 Tax=Magnetospirillum sp. LM-5 TaxID=2681466 RepID=UPI0020C57BCE|nr:sensor histidine kinase [Magnetospirillum sp. LM-5]
MTAICLVVAGASVGPLALTLRAGSYASLSHVVELKVMAAEEFLSRGRMLAQQVTSRTVIRDKLADFHEGRMTREALADFTRDKLQDSLGLSTELQGIARLDAQNQLVVAVGKAFVWPRGAVPAADSRGPTLSPPEMIDGVPHLVVGAPLFSRSGERIGSDLLLINAQRLLNILRDGQSLGDTGDIAIVGKQQPPRLLIPFGQSPIQPGMSLPEDDPVSRAATAAVTGAPPTIDSTGDPILVSAALPSAEWVMVMRTSAAQATASVDRLVLVVTLSALLLALFGVVGLMLVLRPLTGSMIVHTNDMRQQIEVLERTKAELQERTHQLAQSNTDLEQFAYVASHDLQTPLRNIVGYTQLLERRYKGQMDKDADDFITFIVDNSKQMSRLINDLLEYSRVTSQAKPLLPVSARAAVDMALMHLRTDIEKTAATINVGELPRVIADQTRLVSLFQNLIGNAIKYRSPDRPVKIEVTAAPISPTQWRFSVADNGIGIPAQYHDKIFEIFQRLDPTAKAEGTGIGLTLCRRIVTRFGGSIWVESQPDEGSTFHFTLRDAGSISGDCPPSAG